MGTQQILMIVLSVIVVGAAIAVGIQMFDTQADNLARDAVTAELLNQAVMAQAWFRTDHRTFGGGYDIPGFTALFPNADVAHTIAKYISGQAVDGVIDNAVGRFTVTYLEGTEITIEGVHARSVAAGNKEISALAEIDLAQNYEGIKIQAQYGN